MHSLNTSRSAVEEFWERYQRGLPESERQEHLPECFAFGSGPEMADELGALVVAGRKRATASLLWEYQSEGSRLPQVGELSIVLDGRGAPLCIIRTTEVVVKPFNQVDERFAFLEGEGDRSLRHWREAHWAFFAQTCRSLGLEPDQEMPVVCEKFQLVFPRPQRARSVGD